MKSATGGAARKLLSSVMSPSARRPQTWSGRICGWTMQDHWLNMGKFSVAMFDYQIITTKEGRYPVVSTERILTFQEETNYTHAFCRKQTASGRFSTAIVHRSDRFTTRGSVITLSWCVVLSQGPSMVRKAQ